MAQEATYEANLKRATELGYPWAACAGCANFSTPESETCKQCLDDDEEGMDVERFYDGC